MNIWFVIWVFVATFILATSMWSFMILLRQKRGWEAFSRKSHMEYVSPASLKSPVLRGVFNGLKVEMFSDRQIAGKSREGSMRTIFQLTLKSPMPTEGAIGSFAFKNFISGLSLPDQYVPESSGGVWTAQEIYNRLQSREAMDSYFTKERLMALKAMMTIKNTPALLIFSASDTILRIESPDPFDDPVKLEKFLTKATETAKIISL